MLEFNKSLNEALKAAEIRRGYCAPNPAVGAVVVKNNEIIAIGSHWAAGHPHAEIEALQRAGDDAHGATLFVTLEPCCHHGKTPPCTDAIIAAGIKQVIFGFCDPNPKARNGSQVLLDAGIECQQITLPEITAFYRSYAHWIATGRPWVHLKLAVSADDKIAAEAGKPVQITGQECHLLTQQYRYQSDAILTSINTIQNDNPQMNARLPDKTVAKRVFVLDSHLQLDRSAQLFKTAKSITVYHRNDVVARGDLESVAVPFDAQGLDLNAVLVDIGKRGIHDLWVEVGARVFHSFYRQQLVNEFIFYRSLNVVLGDTGLRVFSGENLFDQLKLDWQDVGNDQVARLTITECADKLPNID